MKRSLPAALVLIAVLAACTSQEPSGETSPTATRSSPPTIATQPGLPGKVAEVRAGILSAAQRGDYDMLRPLLDAEVFLSDFGFGIDDEPDPIARWESLGRQPLDVMAALLNMRYAEMDTNRGSPLRVAVVWPRQRQR